MNFASVGEGAVRGRAPLRPWFKGGASWRGDYLGGGSILGGTACWLSFWNILLGGNFR